MASYLLDTNILLRIVDEQSHLHSLATQAVAKLIVDQHQVFITTQNIIEFWAVATRPIAANGLGWSTAQTQAEVAQIMSQFPVLEDVPQIFRYWLQYVTNQQIQGKRVHDSRLVAVMQTYQIGHLLTFNGDDFGEIAGLAIASPASVMGVREE